MVTRNGFAKVNIRTSEIALNMAPRIDGEFRKASYGRHHKLVTSLTNTHILSSRYRSLRSTAFCRFGQRKTHLAPAALDTNTFRVDTKITTSIELSSMPINIHLPTKIHQKKFRVLDSLAFRKGSAIFLFNVSRHRCGQKISSIQVKLIYPNATHCRALCFAQILCINCNFDANQS